MPRYYCDYCDIFLTHDSPSVRKSHNEGWKHKAAVRSYYAQFEEQARQAIINKTMKEMGAMGLAMGGTVGTPVVFNPHAPPNMGGGGLMATPGMPPMHGMPPPAFGIPGPHGGRLPMGGGGPPPMMGGPPPMMGGPPPMSSGSGIPPPTSSDIPGLGETDTSNNGSGDDQNKLESDE